MLDLNKLFKLKKNTHTVKYINLKYHDESFFLQMNISKSPAPRSKIENIIKAPEVPPSPFLVNTSLCHFLSYSDFCHHQVFLPLFEFHINEIILHIHLLLNSFTQYNEIHHVLCTSSLFLLLCSISLHNHTTIHLLNHRYLDCFYYVSIIPL